MEKSQMSQGCRRSCSCGMPSAVPYTMPRNRSRDWNMEDSMSCSRERSTNDSMNRSRNWNMDNSMNRSNDCSMNDSWKISHNDSRNISECRERNTAMFQHLQHLPIAMAYVPCQQFGETFELDYALRVGTIFPELCKPFCGKRGMMR